MWSNRLFVALVATAAEPADLSFQCSRRSLRLRCKRSLTATAADERLRYRPTIRKCGGRRSRLSGKALGSTTNRSLGSALVFLGLSSKMMRLIQLMAPVPALVVGTLVMRHEGIGTAQLGLNLVVGGVALLVCALWKPRREEPSRNPLPLAALGLVLLAATFLHAGLMGVHRWVQVGPLALYAGAISLPMVINAAGELLTESSRRAMSSVLLITTTAGILAAQPDAAQASGLAAAFVLLILALPGLMRDRAVVLGSVLVIGLVAVSGCVLIRWRRAPCRRNPSHGSDRREAVVRGGDIVPRTTSSTVLYRECWTERANGPRTWRLHRWMRSGRPNPQLSFPSARIRGGAHHRIFRRPPHCSSAILRRKSRGMRKGWVY